MDLSFIHYLTFTSFCLFLTTLCIFSIIDTWQEILKSNIRNLNKDNYNLKKENTNLHTQKLDLKIDNDALILQKEELENKLKFEKKSTILLEKLNTKYEKLKNDFIHINTLYQTLKEPEWEGPLNSTYTNKNETTQKKYIDILNMDSLEAEKYIIELFGGIHNSSSKPVDGYTPEGSPIEFKKHDKPIDKNVIKKFLHDVLISDKKEGFIIAKEFNSNFFPFLDEVNKKHKTNIIGLSINDIINYQIKCA